MPRIDDDAPPKGLMELYATVPYPESYEAKEQEAMDLHNLQLCQCGHDRCVHGDLLGSGERQVMVVDCPRAGRCLVRGCGCGGFRFSPTSSEEGRKRRRVEGELLDVVPPEGAAVRPKKVVGEVAVAVRAKVEAAKAEEVFNPFD